MKKILLPIVIVIAVLFALAAYLLIDCNGNLGEYNRPKEVEHTPQQQHEFRKRVGYV